MDGGNFVTGQVYLPVTRSRLLELAGFGDADTLVRYRDDVAQFGYLEFTARSGLPSTYGIVSHWATNFDYHAHVAVPVAISRDTRLSPQAKALYAAFSVAAEYERQGDWPRQPDGNAHPLPPCTRSDATTLTGTSATSWDSGDRTSYGATAMN